ncbi:hypothetical protein BDP27DRAFT_813279 [Rhodocollybia butyracea]|uniref:Translation initiation factor IF-3 n=1 Tax=Rhodocollybia butyracea TaxID=206335 RepID=A0A9P5UEY4_9AGAR|nr:hypothetical protein BDP27DRAFT_813279 [Rhodocollybia butyracea]
MATFLTFRSATKWICTASNNTRAQTRWLHASAPNHSKYKKDSKIRNDKIPYSEVHVVDRDNDGQLVKTTMTELLQNLNPEKSYIELVSTDPFAVVKVVNRKEEIARQRQAKVQQKLNAKKNMKKEFQFTWGMALGDLEYRLGRVKSELKKGTRVDLVFAPKGSQKPPPVHEMRERMQLMADKLADVGIEWKDRELQRGMGALFMQSLRVGSVAHDSEEGGEGAPETGH